ncbi:Uma2 family endonuclease [Streptomyces chrestomyceticus]|uniref:Uma2 family endonuclease n=1 Tax=Streptomyces chrestomyceticus TaxID=68185 RepID=UPI0019D0E8BB|nr:Uma2 family endonuclease [Streptomyces chrestomyceticus]
MSTGRRLETATPETWMSPPADGWTFDQLKDLDLPFAWELVDGTIVARERTVPWHNRVRDRLLRSLEDARRDPYEVLAEQSVRIDGRNTPEPDVIVFDGQGQDLWELESVPVQWVVLVVEVVSTGSQQDDRVRKPAMFAAAGVPYFWRVEHGPEHVPEVHEFWLHRELGRYIPAPEHPLHRTKLETEHPFPVSFDLTGFVRR